MKKNNKQPSNDKPRDEKKDNSKIEKNKKEKQKYKSNNENYKSSNSTSSSPEPPTPIPVKDTDPNIKINKNITKFDPYKMPCRDIHSTYKRVDYIDKGVYGSVHQGKNFKTGEIVALKKVKISPNNQNGFPITALRETNLLLTLKHPNIVNVKEVVTDSYDNGVFMVMEYMEHDIKRVMHLFMKNPFSVSEVKCLMLQLLKGIAFMHDNWVLHRDLKTSNLLYDNKGNLKICDFGMARKYGEPLGNYSPNVITLWYRAPELLLGCKQYSTAVDMWSVGAIMAELLLKKGLFEGKNEFDQMDKIMKVLGTPNINIWPGLKNLKGAKYISNKKYKVNLHNSLSINGRVCITEMGIKLLKDLLCYNPKRRIAAEKALQHPWFNESPKPQCNELMPTFPSRYEEKKRKRKINDSILNIGQNNK